MLPAVPPAALSDRRPDHPDAGAPPAVVRVLAVGAVVLGLAVFPYKLFELDRFFVPKEVALGMVAALALVAATRLRPPSARSADARTHAPASAPRHRDALDLALGAFLIVSVVSAARAASPWLAARSVAISGAGAALFWAARAAGRAGWAPAVLRAAAGLVAVAAGTALLQAYGVRTEYFSLNRAPGGTFGNRNFVAHLCAVGLPFLAYLALCARSARGLAAGLGVLAAAAALVLTRSRAAWLATAVAAVPFLIGLARSALARRGPAQTLKPDDPPRNGVRVRRAALLVGAAVVAALAAVRLPNTLDWRSESPYLDSARGMANYRDGSGQGRLKQWRNSARLGLSHPLLGVGPGHWSAHYPAVAPPGDPSLTADKTTANPWPSSDWVAFAAERGALGVAALGAVMLLLALRAHQLVWRAPTADARLLGGTLGSVLAATLTAGVFDAVLLLAAPTFLAWTALGALAGAAERERDAPPGPLLRRASVLALCALVVAGTMLGAAHAAAMALFATGRPHAVSRAAALAPGDYRIQLRAAQLARQSGRCDEARRAGGRAHAVAPAAPSATRVLRGCGGRRGT